MKDWKATTFIIIGGLFLLITVLLFFVLTSERSAVQWVSLVFMVYVISIATGMSIMLRKIGDKTDRIMSNIGMTVITAIYTAISFLISIIFATGIFDSVATIVIIQVILAAVAAIISVILFLFLRLVSEKEKPVLQAVANIKQIQDDIYVLMSDERNESYRVKLEKIYEAIKYSDISTYTPSDDKLVLKVVELEDALLSDSDEREETIRKILNEIHVLTKKRTTEVQATKRGGF